MDGARSQKNVNPKIKIMKTTFKLNKQEIDNLISAMEQNAERAVMLELTLTNWLAEFDNTGMVQTPIGIVKMGENQYNKIIEKKRQKEFGMIKPTLTNPDVILEMPSRAKDGDMTERPSSLLFVKTFYYGSRIVKFFTSVTVKKEGMEVVVSNHIETRKGFVNDVKKSVLVYKNERLTSNSSDLSSTENQD